MINMEFDFPDCINLLYYSQFLLSVKPICHEILYTYQETTLNKNLHENCIKLCNYWAEWQLIIDYM